MSIEHLAGERVLYVARCGWCGAYEGTVDPTEPCAEDDLGNPIGPHQFEVYERLAAPPTGAREEAHETQWEKLRRLLVACSEATGDGHITRAAASMVLEQMAEIEREIPVEPTAAHETRWEVGEWDAEEDGIPIMNGESGAEEYMVAWVPAHGRGRNFAEQRALMIAAIPVSATGDREENHGTVCCKWCEAGDTPKRLDEDGVRARFTDKPGSWFHAEGDVWWPCPRLATGAPIND